MTATDTSYTLRYRSSRREVWRWYWQRWRTSTWKLHSGLAVVIGWFFGLAPARFAGRPWLATAASMAPALLDFAVISVVVTPEGWSTTIGGRSGSGSGAWADVVSISEDARGSVVIQGRNGNALIVPPRAFASASDKRDILSALAAWSPPA